MTNVFGIVRSELFLLNVFKFEGANAYSILIAMRKLLPILIVLAAFGTGKVLACSCMVSGTVDYEYRKAANVVVLKAIAIEKTEKEPPRLVNYGGIKQTTLTVEKVYKGTLKVGEKLVFAQGGGADCVWTFTEESIGKEYLFYLGAGPIDNKSSDGVIAATGQFPRIVPKDTWVASTCSRSNSLKGAAADILYLDNRIKANRRTRLSGRITKSIESAVEEQPSSVEILSNWNVFIIGNGKPITVKTDMNGVYEVYDLPAGKYKVLPEGIDGFKLDLWSRGANSQVEIRSKAHTERNFDYEIDSSIRGKFFDMNGKPLKDVCLKLVPVHGKKAQYFHNFDCTKADGTFELTEIPTGSYILFFNYDDAITAATPFRAFYYPKANKREDAAEIEIAPGTKIENLVIVAPETADTITISGVLRMQDGKAATNDSAEYASVEFVADGNNKADDDASSRSTIESGGRFQIRILKGQKGRLYGTVMTYPGEYLNCPKLEKLIPKKDGINIVEVKTPIILIDAKTDQTGLELIFPFPSCKKARID